MNLLQSLRFLPVLACILIMPAHAQFTFWGTSRQAPPPPPLPPKEPRVIGYLGMDIGYGKMNETEESILSSSLLDPILQRLLLPPSSKTGGLAWRPYLGGAYRVTKEFAIGLEAGFSWYPRSKFSEEFKVNMGDESISLTNSLTSTGFGGDILINLAFSPVNNFMLSIKPGIQLAHQQNNLILDLNLGDILDDFGFGSFGLGQIGTLSKFKITKVLPEIMVGVNWSPKHSPVAFDLAYQYVFGNDDAPESCRVNTRQMIIAGLSVRF